MIGEHLAPRFSTGSAGLVRWIRSQPEGPAAVASTADPGQETVAGTLAHPGPESMPATLSRPEPATRAQPSGTSAFCGQLASPRYVPVRSAQVRLASVRFAWLSLARDSRVSASGEHRNEKSR